MLAGRYRLERLIGHGSAGRVWMAHDEVLRRRVAIKMVDFPAGMPRSEVEQIGDRTLREARAIGALSNPQVVTLHDIITLPSGPAIVMELLDARPLSAVLTAHGPLRDGQAATVGLAVATGLLAAHQAGITHRDVKPGNVLVATDGRIKLTDFGIARAADEQTLTATGMLLGSPAYIAPEVATGQPATPAADAWGLGALLYACVEGRPPYDRGEAIATLTAVVSDPVPPHPRAGRISRIIDGLLVKDPARRMSLVAAHEALLSVADDPIGLRLRAGAGGGIPMPASKPPAGRAADPVVRTTVESGPPSGSPRTPPQSPVPPADPAPGPAVPPAVSALPAAVAPAVAPAVPPRTGTRASGPWHSATPVAGGSSALAAAGARVPPPPWDLDSASALPPIPAVAPPRRRVALTVVAVLLAVVAVAAGYFGVLAIAGLAG